VVFDSQPPPDTPLSLAGTTVQPSVSVETKDPFTIDKTSCH